VSASPKVRARAGVWALVWAEAMAQNSALVWVVESGLVSDAVKAEAKAKKLAARKEEVWVKTRESLLVWAWVEMKASRSDLMWGLESVMGLEVQLVLNWGSE